MKVSNSSNAARFNLGKTMKLGVVGLATTGVLGSALLLTPDNTPIAQAQTAGAATTTMETAVFNQINAYRATQKLPALKLNSTITTQARNHSVTQASTKRMSHDGFQTRINTIGQTVPWSGAAENVAYNYGYSDPATVAVNGWIKSPGHLANIKGNFNLTGIGVAKNSQGQVYFTQIFIRSR
ncbi:MAG: CAP domain-containing protein [Alkalinema sp. RU_4_3]|nr:CAP domain-containing protein [Alkalinema sp. RU_4_3]